MARAIWLAFLSAALVLVAGPAAQAGLVAAYSQDNGIGPDGFPQQDVRLVDPLDTSATVDPNSHDEQVLSHVNTQYHEGKVSLSADGERLLLFRDNGVDDAHTPASSGIPPDSWIVADRKVNPLVAVSPMTIDGYGGRRGGAGWFPDGHKIAFVQDGVEYAEIEHLKGSQPIQATDSGHVSSGLVNPDVKDFVAVATDGTLAWPAHDPRTDRDVIVVNQAGGQPLILKPPELAHAEVRLEDVAFSPNRSELFFTYEILRSSGNRRDLGGIRLDKSPPLFESYDVFLESVLPGIHAGQEEFPRWTADGRYLAWIELGSQQRIRVFDRLTDTMVNEGRPVGTEPIHSFALGESDVVLPTFLLPQTIGFGSPAVVSAKLREPTGIGLLVERILRGHRRLFGRRVRRLKVVGRVPLGKHRRRHLKLH